MELDPGSVQAQTNLGSAFFAARDYSRARPILEMCKDKASVAKRIESLYHLGKKEQFLCELEEQSLVDKGNIRLAAVSHFVSKEYGVPDPYPFCREPLKSFKAGHLGNHVDDVDEFIEEVLESLETADTQWEPLHRTTRFGFQSKGDLFSGTLDVLTRLKESLE